MDEFDTPDPGEQNLDRRAWVVLVLPVALAGTLFQLRAGAGPFWQWNLLDPSYFYLLDALNLLNGEAPGHVFHPGVTVQAIGALVLGAMNLVTPGDATAAVLDDPERYLRLLSDVVIVLNALTLVAVGLAGRRAFGAWLPGFVCQLAPFMSTIVLKHAFLPKPEAFLVAATSVLIALMLLALRPADGGTSRLAAGFGIVAGFVAATKITAVPVLIVPLFLLRGAKAWSVYGVTAAVAAALFVMPAWGSIDIFLDWIGKVAVGAGPHGSGARTVIDLAAYPEAFAKILKRPSLRVPLILAALAFAAVWWRRRLGWPVPGAEAWALAAVSAATLAQTALVAKQPTAFYMIPSYMLGAVSVLLSVRLLWALRPEGLRLPVAPASLAAGLFAVAVAAQAAGAVRLSHQLGELREQAASIDNDAFEKCARVYIYSASAPVYAMFLANKVTGERFTHELKERFPANDYWIDDWWTWEPTVLRNWDGEQDFAVVRASYPCLFMRGNRPNGLRRFLERQGAAGDFDYSCTAGLEQFATLGVDCRGNPTEIPTANPGRTN